MSLGGGEAIFTFDREGSQLSNEVFITYFLLLDDTAPTVRSSRFLRAASLSSLSNSPALVQFWWTNRMLWAEHFWPLLSFPLSSSIDRRGGRETQANILRGVVRFRFDPFVVFFFFFFCIAHWLSAGWARIIASLHQREIDNYRPRLAKSSSHCLLEGFLLEGGGEGGITFWRQSYYNQQRVTFFVCIPIMAYRPQRARLPIPPTATLPSC